ncbi:MAG: DNA integrity scanning diadenylate cyclase DisA [Candidatus Nanoarchaeia archaeon]|nr:DNA integrity scanning diadenylate cyclase DisA [Candidatus Nanoarchaeia archaeon]
MEKKEVLRMFAYGRDLRNAIDKISKSGRGALVVFVNNNKIKSICSGGFKIEEKFTQERLAELAKLDGAILLDEDFEEILNANVLLIPDINVSSSETGTRHQAAERVAKQFETLVLAVSEKSKIATIYYKKNKLKLSSLNELFTKTGDALKSLEKHEEIYRELIKKFDVSEILELVTLEDLVLIFQRKKIIDLVAEILSVFLAELGKEGKLIELQLKETMNFVNKETDLMVKDYSNHFKFENILEELERLQYDDVINQETIYTIFLNNRKKEMPLVPRGFRILRNIPLLTEENINLVVSEFPSLQELMLSSEAELKAKGVADKKAKAIKEYLLKF